MLPCELAARPFLAYGVHRKGRESECNVSEGGVIIGESVGKLGPWSKCVFYLVIHYDFFGSEIY